jgi:hypothetical protein
VHFCTIDQLTPTNAPNQVLSLISLLKDYPNTHLGITPPDDGNVKIAEMRIGVIF